MTGAQRQPAESVAAALAQVGAAVRQLKVLRYLFLGIAASLPGDPAGEGEAPVGAAARLRADIECALADALEPLIAALERAARHGSATLAVEEE
jgi:hypothetical protein